MRENFPRELSGEKILNLTSMDSFFPVSTPASTPLYPEKVETATCKTNRLVIPESECCQAIISFCCSYNKLCEIFHKFISALQ